MENLKTVFWDLDGTLADTEISGHRLAFNLAFKDYGLDWEWDKKIYIDLLKIGGGRNRILKFGESLSIDLNNDFIDKLHRRKQHYYINLLNEGKINIRTGVIRLIKLLNSLNISQYIVTTSAKESVEVFLSNYCSKKSMIFKGYISGDDVPFHKPSPEAYQLAMKISNSNYRQCLAIEDSLIGVQSAKSAGLKCLLTLSPWLDSITEGMKIADLVVDKLGEINSPFKVLYGHTNEDMVNYDCLLSILNNK